MRTPAALVGLSLVAATTVIAAAPADAATPKCFGKKATITVTKKNKTVKGTKKNDVIIVSSKATGDVIVGNGGTDRICAVKVRSISTGSGADQVQLTDGKVSTGAGNDEVVQKGTGKVTVDGGAGNDVIQVSKGVKAGSVLTGGADLDSLTVPAAQLPNVSIPVTSGDRLNGINLGVDQPANGGPAFAMAFDDGGFVNGVWTVDAEPATGYAFSGSPSFTGTELDVTPIAFAPGRTPGRWSFDPGDGTAPQTGLGVPPSYLEHEYLGAGSHVATLTVTDDLGVSSSRSLSLNSTLTARPSLSIGAPTYSGQTATFALTVPTGPTYYPVTSWIVEYGDGTEQTGTGAVPATVSHTYPAGRFSVDGEVLDSSGSIQTASSSTTVSLGATPNLAINTYYDGRLGQSALHVMRNSGLDIEYAASQGYDSYTLDLGNGTTPIDSPQSTSTYISYDKVGTYTVKLLGHLSGQPDAVLTRTVVVADPPSSLKVSVPSIVPEGPVAVSFAGSTVAPGATWTYQDSTLGGFAQTRGTGPLPAVTHTFSAETHTGFWASVLDNMISVDVSNGPLPLTDTTTMPYDISVFKQLEVAPLGTRSGPVGFDGFDEINSFKGSASTGADGITLNPFSPVGVKLTSVSIAVDGTTLTETGAPLAQSPTQLAHTFGVGEHPVVATVIDSLKRTSRSFGHVSIAGKPTITAPAAATGTNASTTIGGLSSAAGTNGALIAWSVDYDSGTDVSGYGPLPASLTTSFPSGTAHSARISVFDDHGQTASKTVAITTS